jgi:hypothetical protein
MKKHAGDPNTAVVLFLAEYWWVLAVAVAITIVVWRLYKSHQKHKYVHPSGGLVSTNTPTGNPPVLGQKWS